jgi:hypothetical protein
LDLVAHFSPTGNKSFDEAALDDVLTAATPPNEKWAVYPDEHPMQGFHPGDKRMLAIVRLANETFHGQFQWMLYGDDDIFWFMESVEKLLARFDSVKPYLLTDDVNGCCHHGGHHPTTWCPFPHLGLHQNACLPPGEDAYLPPPDADLPPPSPQSKCTLKPAAEVCTRARLEAADMCKCDFPGLCKPLTNDSPEVG